MHSLLVLFLHLLQLLQQTLLPTYRMLLLLFHLNDLPLGLDQLLVLGELFLAELVVFLHDFLELFL